MRRLYIVRKQLIFEPLIVNGAISADHIHDIFHPTIGSHFIDLPNDMILLCTSFDHSEWCEDFWHAHPEVAILPHPSLEGKLPMKHHVGRDEYKYTQQHHNALLRHETLGVVDTDTVLDLAAKAARIHPLVRFRNVL